MFQPSKQLVKTIQATVNKNYWKQKQLCILYLFVIELVTHFFVISIYYSNSSDVSSWRVFILCKCKIKNEKKTNLDNSLFFSIMSCITYLSCHVTEISIILFLNYNFFCDLVEFFRTKYLLMSISPYWIKVTIELFLKWYVLQIMDL